MKTGPDQRVSNHDPVVMAQFLEIHAVRIIKAGQIMTVLYQSGLLEERDEPLGHIQKDGRFVDLLGNVLVTMSIDGRIVFPHGEIRIAPDGTTWTQWDASPREVLRIEPTGKVIGPKENVQIEGLCNDCRRLAAYALILPDILRLQRDGEVH